VAGLKDGTHILFHDGVWDEKSTGKGSVASSRWDIAQKFLLKETDGDFSADRPIRFSEALILAEDKLYLEVDFKSSAKYETVIRLIRKAEMADQVILIAYNIKQARRLAKLAPEMMLSVSAKAKGDIEDHKSAGVKMENMAVWLGKGPYDKGFIAYLDENSIPVLAWPRERDRKKSWGPATVAVTDYALQKKPIEGLSRSDKNKYEACLTR